MIKAILFDFDGTLTELTLAFRKTKEEILGIGRKYVAEDSFRECETLFILDTIYAIEAKCGVSGPAFRKEAFGRLSELELEAAEGKDLFPYTRGLLRELQGRGIKTAILTRSCRAAVLRVFPDIMEYVDAVVTREDVERVKPDASHVQKALSMLGAGKDEAMIVGDEKIDILAGKALNIRTVGVLTGSFEKRGFDEVQPTHIVQDVREILALL